MVSNPNYIMPVFMPPTIPSQMLLPPGKSGIVLGQQGLELVGLRFGSEGNVLLIGGPGSGKSSCILSPSLSRWDGPFVVLDIKGQLKDRFVPHCGNERQVIILNPDDPSSLSVDPFDWLESEGDENLLSNVTALATIFIPNTQWVSDPFWVQSERAVFIAAVHCYYKAGLSFPQAITRVLELPLLKLCNELENFSDVHVTYLIGGLKSMNSKTIGCIERGLKNKLLPLASENSLLHFFRGRREGAHVFSLNELDKSLVFIQIPQNRVERWGPGVTLLLTMILKQLECRPEAFTPEAEGMDPFLVAIDEFPRFGRLPMISDALATLRSKSVNLLLAVQSLSQLDALYGSQVRATIFDCCSYRVVLRVADPVNQRLVADMIGNYMAFYPSYSTTYDGYCNPCGYGSQVNMRWDYIIQPSALATLDNIIITSPNGAFWVQKLSPMSPQPERPLIEDTHESKKNSPPSCNRSLDAENRVAAYLSLRPTTQQNNPEFIATAIGKLVQRYYPEFLLPDTDINSIENMLRVIAADSKLIADVQDRAKMLDSQCQ